MNSKIEAVVFDMDGVIFDTEILYQKAWLFEAPKYNISKVEELFNKMMGMSNVDIEKLFKSAYGEDFPYTQYRADVRAKISEYIEKDGLSMKTGVVEILSFLKENGYPIALATSTTRTSVESHLAKSGIKQYFDFIVTGDEVINSKPAPEIYLKACKGLGVMPQNAIAVEDSFNGIRSAFNAGMMPIMIPDTVMPDEEITELLFKKFNNLLELIEFLKN